MVGEAVYVREAGLGACPLEFDIQAPLSVPVGRSVYLVKVLLVNMYHLHSVKFSVTK